MEGREPPRYSRTTLLKPGGISGIIATMPSDTADTIALTLRLERDLHRRMRIAAAYEEKTLTEWMREALTLVVERVEAHRAQQ